MTLFNAAALFSRVSQADVKAHLPRHQHRVADSSPEYVRMKLEKEAAERHASRVEAQLAEVTAERNELEHQKEEHQREYPGGCWDAREVPMSNPAWCPGTSRLSDHVLHGIWCMSEVEDEQ